MKKYLHLLEGVRHSMNCFRVVVAGHVLSILIKVNFYLFEFLTFH